MTDPEEPVLGGVAALAAAAAVVDRLATDRDKKRDERPMIGGESRTTNSLSVLLNPVSSLRSTIVPVPIPTVKSELNGIDKGVGSELEKEVGSELSGKEVGSELEKEVRQPVQSVQPVLPVQPFSKSLTPPPQLSQQQQPPPPPPSQLLPPPSSPPIYPIDAGIIRCICGFDDDDGFTIQCEKCNAWQHAQCVDIIDEAHAPEIYLCDQCGHIKVDVQAAIEKQTKRINSLTNGRKRKQRSRSRKDTNDGSPDSKSKSSNNSPKSEERVLDGGSANSNGNISTNNSNSTDKSTNNSTNHSTNNNSTNNSNNFNNSNNSTNNNTAPTNTTSSSTNDTNYDSDHNNTKRNRRKRLSSENDTHSTTSSGGHNTPNKPDRSHSPNDIESSIDFDEKFSLNQYFKCQFVSVTENHLTSAKIKEYINSIPSLHLDEDSCSFLTKQEFTHIKPAKVVVKQTCDQSKQKFGGFSKFGLFLESSIQRHRFVIEKFGEIMFESEYKANPVNQYRLFGCPKPGVLFVPNLDIVIDGRRIGSDAGFIRNSCKPNVKFSIIVVENKYIHFAAFALEPIKSGSELTVGWEWNINHPVHKVLSNDEDSLTIDERVFLVKSYQMIQQRGIECACKSNDCVLIRMKKAGLGGPRSTRLSKKSGELKQLQIDKQRLEQKNSIDSITNTPSVPSTPLYSLREERKIQGAMSLMEKMEKESAKRKREDDDKDNAVSSVAIESTASVPTVSVSTPTPTTSIAPPVPTTPPAPAPAPPTAALTSTTSPPSSPKRQRTESPTPLLPITVTPNQKRLAKYLLAKQEYISQKVKTRQPSPISISPRFGHSPPSPSRGNFVGTALPNITITSQLQLLAAAEQTPSPLSPRNSFAFPSNSPLTATTAGLGINQTTATTKPAVKKKLSFADYKKKQRPISSSNLSTTSTPVSDTNEQK